MFGVFGVDVRADRIIINPHSLSFANELKLTHLRIRGLYLDITILPTGTFEVKNDSDIITSDIGTPVEIVF
jgi:hypothetical protein